MLKKTNKSKECQNLKSIIGFCVIKSVRIPHSKSPQSRNKHKTYVLSRHHTCCRDTIHILSKSVLFHTHAYVHYIICCIYPCVYIYIYIYTYMDTYDMFIIYVYNIFISVYTYIYIYIYIYIYLG